MIPFHLHRQFGTDAHIVTYKNSTAYPYLDTALRGLKLDFIKKSPFGIIADGIGYLKKNAKDIDILNIYHLNLSSYFYSIFYKLFNKKGVIYLKVDMNEKGYRDCFVNDPKGFIKRSTIKRADIVSVENKRMFEGLKSRFGNKIKFITNGYYIGDRIQDIDEVLSGSEREDVILTVGNLGTYEKATDTLLEAFAKSAPYHSYKLKLIGPVAKDFIAYRDKFMREHEDLKDRIIFTGPVYDKEKLMGEYLKARFFTLPSRSESFGFVLLEAGAFGCILLPSDKCCAALDMTDNGRLGYILKADDIQSIADTFKTVTEGNEDLSRLSLKTAEYIRKNYSWENIVTSLYENLSPTQEVQP
ncbi:MAG: glycosyltransferase [Lachnospiraceae bacterium]|nr:glycosyltransferase [Lachnospiraceae bacterium]